MTIFNLGSINADYFYKVPHIPAPGETLAARSVEIGLGGKGANMSVAAVRGGGHVVHIGAVGSDGQWAIDRLLDYGVDVTHVGCGSKTAHAIIVIDDNGENSIIIFPGANKEIDQNNIEVALKNARSSDIFVTQNETSGQVFGAQLAKKLGMRIVYAAAPFDVDAVREMLNLVDILVLNEVECQQLIASLGIEIHEIPVSDIIVTLGAKGCVWYNTQEKTQKKYDGISVDAIDTTGAGDTFTGYLLAGLDRGAGLDSAIKLANKAGAIMVTRHGTADVIPDLEQIQDHFS